MRLRSESRKPVTRRSANGGQPCRGTVLLGLVTAPLPVTRAVIVNDDVSFRSRTRRTVRSDGSGLTMDGCSRAGLWISRGSGSNRLVVA